MNAGVVNQDGRTGWRFGYSDLSRCSGSTAAGFRSMGRMGFSGLSRGIHSKVPHHSWQARLFSSFCQISLLAGWLPVPRRLTAPRLFSSFCQISLLAGWLPVPKRLTAPRVFSSFCQISLLAGWLPVPKRPHVPRVFSSFCQISSVAGWLPVPRRLSAPGLFSSFCQNLTRTVSCDPFSTHYKIPRLLYFVLGKTGVHCVFTRRSRPTPVPSGILKFQLRPTPACAPLLIKPS